MFSRYLVDAEYMKSTWNMAAESSLKPSEPGCLTSDMADGSSTASTALKLMSPNARSWVSGWALSWWEVWGKTMKRWPLSDERSRLNIWKNSRESWIDKAVTLSRPGSQTQSWWGWTWARIRQRQCRGTPSLCCSRKSLPGSGLGPPWRDRRWCHLRREEDRRTLNHRLIHHLYCKIHFCWSKWLHYLILPSRCHSNRSKCQNRPLRLRSPQTHISFEWCSGSYSRSKDFLSALQQ